tara:strand:+ start:159 stop:728 length:570 start_codon:yes stop_codon:yes gene_type:complete
MPIGLGALISGVAGASTKYKKFKKYGKALSSISGFFGSKKKRAEEKQKLTDFSELLGQQYTSLQGTVGDVQQEFEQMRGFESEAQGLEQRAAVMGYGANQQQMAGQIAGTGLSGVGAGQEAMQLAQQEFANQQMARALQSQESQFNLGLREASRMRDIQAAGFQLDKARAEKGLSKKNYGQSLMDMMEV